MKKFLLSIATVLFGATMMSAADVVFDFANETYGLTRETENNGAYIEPGTALTANGGVTITLNKTEGKNGWRLWSDGLRIYKNSGSSMTLTSATENITAVEFTMAKTGIIEAYAVNGAATVNVENKVFTVSCDASTVNLDLTCTKNNGAIVSMKVTVGGEGGGGETPEPDPVATTGNGSKESPYTVADVIKLNNDGQTGVWVKGVIVGVMNYVDGTGNVFSASELTTGTNIVIAGATTGYEQNYVCVQLPAGAVREALSLVAHPEILGKEVSICGNLASYCGTWGVKNTKDYVLDGQSVPEPDPVTTTGDGSESKPYTVADVIALNNTKTGNAWVTGYIVGSAPEASASSLTNATGDGASVSNIFIAATAGETDYTKCVPVQLPVGDLRTALNLKDNAGNLGKVLNIYGSLEKYYTLAGVKTPSAYTLDGEGGGGVTPTPTDTEGQGTETDPYTIADVIKLNNNGATGKWVNGIIVGVMNYDETAKANVFSATELTTNSNIVIAATASGYEQNYVCVQLPAGKVRDDLNLVDRPGNLGKEVSVCGDLIKYCGIWGVKNTTAYTIVGGLAPLPVDETASLTSFVEDQCSSNTKILGTVTVFYQSADKKYTFITDGETNLEVYGAMTNAYVNGDQLSGIIGKFSYYQNMPQMTPQVDSFGAPVHGSAVEPVEKALGSVAPADYVIIKGATITEEVGESSTTYTVSQGAASRQLFNRFNISGIAAAENVDIVGIGAVYGENAQLFPVSITANGEGGINEITAESASTVIFDLQGRRLSAPVKGINIINGRKVLVK